MASFSGLCLTRSGALGGVQVLGSAGPAVLGQPGCRRGREASPVEVAGRYHLPSAVGRLGSGTQWQSGLCSLVHRGAAFFLVACPFVVGCVPIL